MSAQGTVTIGDKQWDVEIMSTPAELSAGLSNVPSIPANTGMLFNLGIGYEVGGVQVNMGDMLFPLDIVFIDSSNRVTGVASDVQPGGVYEFTGAARYLLEVNALEADGVSVGDTVTITGLPSGVTIDVSGIMSLMIVVMMVGMMMRVVES